MSRKSRERREKWQQRKSQIQEGAKDGNGSSPRVDKVAVLEQEKEERLNKIKAKMRKKTLIAAGLAIILMISTPGLVQSDPSIVPTLNGITAASAVLFSFWLMPDSIAKSRIKTGYDDLIERIKETEEEKALKAQKAQEMKAEQEPLPTTPRQGS